jgi:hypothetical protein
VAGAHQGLGVVGIVDHRAEHAPGAGIQQLS